MPTNETNTVREIAELQQRIKALLDETGAQVARMETDMATKTNALRKAIEADRSGACAQRVATALANDRVNVGTLCCRFSDALERHNQTVYPHAYEPIRATWALVTNTCD